jgi:hypothetical protein
LTAISSDAMILWSLATDGQRQSKEGCQVDCAPSEVSSSELLNNSIT